MADALAIFPKVEEIFDPVLYNDVELPKIMALELGLSPAILLRDIQDLPPDGVVTLTPLIERLFDLEELRKHRGQEWAGVEMVREACQLMLDYREQYQANKMRSGRGFHPSMHTFDSRKRSRFGGIGSDSGRVRTYFSEDGKRAKFAVNLTAEAGSEQWVFSTATIDTSWGDLSDAGGGPPIELIERTMGDNGILECPICGHAETYDLENSAAEPGARANMRRHCKTAKNEIEAHLLLCDEVDG